MRLVLYEPDIPQNTGAILRLADGLDRSHYGVVRELEDVGALHAQAVVSVGAGASAPRGRR